MTDTLPPTSDHDAHARDRAARQRFLAIGLFRLSGALILVVGIAIGQQRFGWVGGDKAKAMGAIVAVVGILQMVLVPRLLIRAWRTPQP